jgi:hypothetical protein
MTLTQCSKRTIQRAITEVCQQGSIIQDDGRYRLPLSRDYQLGGGNRAFRKLES